MKAASLSFGDGVVFFHETKTNGWWLDETIGGSQHWHSGKKQEIVPFRARKKEEDTHAAVQLYDKLCQLLVSPYLSFFSPRGDEGLFLVQGAILLHDFPLAPVRGPAELPKALALAAKVSPSIGAGFQSTWSLLWCRLWKKKKKKQALKWLCWKPHWYMIMKTRSCCCCWRGWSSNHFLAAPSPNKTLATTTIQTAGKERKERMKSCLASFHHETSPLLLLLQAVRERKSQSDSTRHHYFGGWTKQKERKRRRKGAKLLNTLESNRIAEGGGKVEGSGCLLSVDRAPSAY